MTSPTRGRPHASSREVLADAACELFLEQGYQAASVAEISRRAGVSRASFFNYFDSKADILWYAFDGHVSELETALRDPGVTLSDALVGFGDGPAPETLALGIVDAHTMGLEEELCAGRALRQQRVAQAIAERLLRDGTVRVSAEIIAAAYAAALAGAVWRWATLGAGRHSLSEVVGESLEAAERLVRMPDQRAAASRVP
ncbi:MAG: TetR/AcrR family transcriptional regulator [Leucobacter sp.]